MKVHADMRIISYVPINCMPHSHPPGVKEGSKGGNCPCSRAREVGRCRAFAHGSFNSNLKMESQTTKEVLVKLGE